MASTPLQENWVIENVPEDVWQDIFKMAILDDPDIDAASRTTRTVEKSLYLSHVCSRFYNIIADVPDLWTDIVLRMDQYGNSSPKERLIILAFKRASTKPLTLSLAYSLVKINLGYNAPSAYLGSNIPSSLSRKIVLTSFVHFALNVHRAKYLRIDAHLLNTTCIRNFAVNKTLVSRAASDCIFVNRHAPLLEKLELVGSLRRPAPEEYEIGLYVKGLAPFLRRAVQMSPKLHTLVLRRPLAGQPVMIHDPQIYCHTLVNLDVSEGCMPASELYLILSSAGALARCKIGRLVGTIPSRARARYLPSLRELFLVGSSHTTDYARSPPLTHFLSFVKAPSLKTLVLRRDREWLQQYFLLFITHSAFSLEHLVLDREQSTEQQKLEFLCLLPNLKFLEIHSMFDSDKNPGIGPHHLTDAFAKCLTTWDVSRGEFSICPRLESFGYDKNGVEVDADDPVLSSMIEYRWNGAPGRRYLKAVSVCGVGRCSLYDIQRLLVLQKEGLDVTFYEPPCSKKFICRE
ncbi:hypothetical protein CVT25_007473 [Psilocybe cyanescens]|uniref:F-box domain-containing protein n=1 Tax=Psilocybe cyanescens TaxID=93625 RepID=A0A409XVQ6_PSICY|nr:hypothetical protein CVT25_007473 [Psilocybe cyanescens]